MVNVNCLNNIASVGLDLFSDDYNTESSFEDAQAVLVRSAKMHDMELGDNLLAIARAGAGVNNIPLDKCAESGIVVFNTPGANAKVEDAIMKIVNMYATAYLDEKGIKKAGKSKEVSPEEKIATLEKKVKSLSSKKMMLYSDYKDDKLTREEYVKRSKAMVEQIDELHQEIEQLKTEIPPEDNSSSKFETQLESIINMESFDREKIQKVIKKVIINGEDNIEIVWNTDDPFFK